ncbi:MAG: hypothetical protein FJ006_12235, partial [Chloroflexi bacterium]|nr:hypothetical protein [Chloroflexota bacterium]
YTGTLTSADLTGNRTYTLPDATGNFCLDTGNCAGQGANLGGSGTANYLARWQSQYALENSSLYDNGNVGIGTTNPTTKLYVSGTGTITGATALGSTLGVSGATTLSSTLDVTGASVLHSTLNVTDATILSSTLGVTSNTTIGGNLQVSGTGTSYIVGGNVGIGTTSPAQKLHVEGQCVAEDSLIPTLKSSANLKFEIFNFQSNSNDLILKQIKNIEAGDQVLSLNEHAGQFEWQKVEKTLDMGVREVYELITESGKRIETTGNHPYLARRLFSGKFSKEDKSQENHDQSYSPTDIYLSRQIGKINHSFSKISSSLTANVIDTIPSNRESVKTENSLTVSGRIRRPDPTLVNTAESTLSWEGRNAIEKPINESVEESKNIVNRLAKSKWIKVAYLKVGDEIATLDGWEKVVSLKITGRKHVYDLQIANTHNFVANGIVAHNTYISSNVGIGTTSPSYQLQLSADSAAKPTSSTWTIASDIRIKDVVGPYNRGLAEILQINPILYTYKENNALGIIDPGQHIGIAAQEVQKVIPEAIATDSGGYLHFTADPLNWAMVNAIKEQQEQIASLSGQLATANEAITSLSKANLSEQEIIVSDLNGPIKIGDPITSSEIPGVGMKSTRAGPIVGKALEPFDPATGKGEIIECPNDYNNNNNYKCGKIMAFVNVSWFDPGVFLTSTGGLQIEKFEARSTKSEMVRQAHHPEQSRGTNSNVQNSNDQNVPDLENSNLDIVSNFEFRISNLKTGEIIDRIGAFSEAAIANLQTGIAETRQLIAGTANVEEKIVSPVVETGTIRSGFGDLVISLDRYPANQDSESSEIASSSAFGKLLVKGVNNEVVASIDAEGNARLAGDLQARQASFAGQVTVNKLESERVTSDELVSETATITGTLYANKIESEEISALTGKFGEILARMEKVESQALPPDQSLTPNLIPTPTPEPTASSSALLAEVDAFVKELLASQAELGWAQAASVSADLKIADNITVNSEQLASTIGGLTVNNKLSVLGSTSLADTTIAGNLLVDGTLSLSANSIASLGPLYLSSAEGIDF